MKVFLLLLIPVLAMGYSQLVNKPADVTQSHWFDYNYLADDYYPDKDTEIVLFNLQFIWRHGSPGFHNFILEIYEDSMAGKLVYDEEFPPTFAAEGWDYDGRTVYLLEFDMEAQPVTLYEGTEYWFAFTLWYSGLDPHPPGWPECLEREQENWGIARYEQNGIWRWLYSDLCIGINTETIIPAPLGVEGMSLGKIKAVYND